MKKYLLLSFTLISMTLCVVHAAPLVTAFSYQGRLTDRGNPANGNFDFQFRLFDAATNGGQVPVVLVYPTVAVSNGLFTTGLDFGSNVFNGTTWWLEISLRPSGTFGEFTFLSPRQPLTPAPNALFSVNARLAATATTANSVAASAVSPAQLSTPSAPASGQVLAYDGSSLAWTNASTVAAGWSLTGNDGTVPGVDFLGTSDNQPFELRVNGQRALRIEPNTNGSPNVVGGASFNQIDAGVVGATIAGGGGTDASGANRISANVGVIGGGSGNTIQSNTFGATIAGGTLNTIQSVAFRSTIGGGAFNTVQAGAFHSTIAGGFQNTIQTNANASTIGGGLSNTILADAPVSTIAGGENNVIQSRASFSFIGGGLGNIIGTNGVWAVIPGGWANSAAGQGSFAAGSGAKALHDGAFVWSDFLPTVPPNFASSTTNEFAVRATGGVRIVSAVDFIGTPLAGVTLPAGSGSWTTLSDRNAKTNFAPVNPRQLLDRLAQLPIQTWNYKSQPVSSPHIGPVAQDFAAAFNVGEDDRHIATVDADGVALAAIQALNDVVNEKETRISELENRNARLENRLAALEKLVADLGPKENASRQNQHIKALP